jgi:hypothetical protein
VLKARNVKKKDMDGMVVVYEERDLKFWKSAGQTLIWSQFVRRFNTEQEWFLTVADEMVGDEPLGIAVVSREWLPTEGGKITARVLDFYVLEKFREEGEKILAKACLQCAIAMKATRVVIEAAAMNCAQWADSKLVEDTSPRMSKELVWNKPYFKRKEVHGDYESLPGIDPVNYSLGVPEYEAQATVTTAGMSGCTSGAAASDFQGSSTSTPDPETPSISSATPET